MKAKKAICRILYKLGQKVSAIIYRIFSEPCIKGSCAFCGKKVRIGRKSNFRGIENISIGDYSSIGEGTKILTTRAKVKIGTHVMFGPGVTIVSGNHRTDVIGKYMSQITDADKRPEDDRDVIIEDDVWIGANATILMGVTIGRGCVIAAGAVVNKDCPPYCVLGGVPARVLKTRFTLEQITEHEKALM